jgi:hypothetical protein
MDLAGLLVGQSLDHFQIDGLVGGGGMGAVFRGRDLRLNRTVAIKVIPSAKRDAETLRRFRVEAQSAAKLDHPNIARVYDVGETDLWNYIVFEFIEGTNLRDLVQKQGPLEVDDAVCFAMQIAEALNHACSRDVVHRDIKPSNILITTWGQAKLVDMGLARTTAYDQSSRDETASGVTLGTFDYISPEQARNPRDADVRSDLYSLGCTLYFLLVGHPPFHKGTALQKLLQHGTQTPEDPRYLRDDLSDDLVSILFKLMAKRPIQRYQRPLDLLADLQVLADVENLRRSQSIAVTPVAPQFARKSLWESLTPWVLGACLLLVSTFWLQSMDRQLGEFELPAYAGGIREPIAQLDDQRRGVGEARNGEAWNGEARNGEARNGEARNGEARNGEARNGEGISEAVSQAGAASEGSLSGVLVSSEIIMVVPVGAETGGLGGMTQVDSLSAAIVEAGRREGIREIWIASNELESEPLVIPRSGLTMAAAPGYHPVVHCLAPTSSYLDDFDDGKLPSPFPSWMELRQHRLSLRGVHLVANPAPSSANFGMFHFDSGAELSLRDCTLTIENDRRIQAAMWIYKNGRPDADAISTTSLERSEPQLRQEPARIRLENVVVRGECDGLWIPEGRRTEVEWHNGLAAISGSLLRLGGSELRQRTSPSTRIQMHHVTAICGTSFAKIELGPELPSPIRLIREARGCVFWTPWDSSLIRLSGLSKLSDARDMLDMRGEDNAYDEGIRWLATTSTIDEVEEKLDWIEAVGNALTERSPESAVRWLRRVPPDVPFHRQTPDLFEQRPGIFLPGMRLHELPQSLRGTLPSPLE